MDDKWSQKFNADLRYLMGDLMITKMNNEAVIGHLNERLQALSEEIEAQKETAQAKSSEGQRDD